jgi:hypothetical protein
MRELPEAGGLVLTERIKFMGENGSLTVEVYRYERPGTEDADDANWLNCEVSVKAGAFGGNFKCAFTTHDFVALHQRLKTAVESLTGNVSFQNTEADLFLNIDFGKRGATLVHGKAQPHRSPEGTLSFEFDSDQSYLAQTLCQLEAVLRHFPVRQMS